MVTENNKEEIKFGIMCNGTVFPAWQAETIENLLLIDSVKCELLIIDGNKGTQKSGKKLLPVLLFFSRDQTSL